MNDTCALCGHNFHGLPCTAALTSPDWHHSVQRPCRCPGPFPIDVRLDTELDEVPC